MPPISTRLHGVGDVAGTALTFGAPRLLPIRDRRAQGLIALTGATLVVNTAFTDYEFGIRRKFSMSTHLLVDAIAGGLLVASATALARAKGTKAPDWLPLLGLGLGQIAAAALTERHPRRELADASPVAATGISGEGFAAREPAQGGAPLAPPPVETPGPSVPAPGPPASDVERREQIDAAMPDSGSPQTGSTLVAREEAAAAAEAAAIGGVGPDEGPDPAMAPVYEAGGGEQDGWEQAEADLIENATHGDGAGNPLRDAFTPEVESDRATPVDADADRVISSETPDDPES